MPSSCLPPLLPCRYALHAGGKLAPPLGGAERMESWPGLVATDVEVSGDSWKGSSGDVAIAGDWLAALQGGLTRHDRRLQYAVRS